MPCKALCMCDCTLQPAYKSQGEQSLIHMGVQDISDLHDYDLQCHKGRLIIRILVLQIVAEDIRLGYRLRKKLRSMPP